MSILRWSLLAGFLVAGAVLFFFFFHVTASTNEGERFTLCDEYWHEHLYHGKQLPENCKDEMNTKYTINLEEE